MDTGRSTFTSGLILGAVLGLTVGHFALWSRFEKDDVTTIPQASTPYFQKDFPPGSSARTASLPPEFMTFSEISESSTPNVQLTAPFENAIAFETAAPSDETQQVAELDTSVKRIPLDSESNDEPQPLSIPEAQPLKTHTSKSEQQIRELIELELPNAPASQREVWFESLKDLKSEDVSGVLKMWKMFGGPIATAASMPNLNPTFAPPIKNATTSDTQRLIEDAIHQHRQNLLMHAVPGYKRTIPMFVESIVDGKSSVSELRSRIDFQRGTACKTDHPFDLMIESRGLFCVKTVQGETFYTSRGRFGLTENHYLCLKINNEEYILQPEIRLATTEEFDAFAGESNDAKRTFEVTIIDHNDLISAGNGLFTARENAKVFTQKTWVLMGQYESSNTDLSQEQRAIDALKELVIPASE